jgi:hypothetical protein
MVEPAEREALEKMLQGLWIIWEAMVCALVVFVFIVHQFGEEIRSSVGAGVPMDLLVYILYGMATITLLVSFLLRKFMLSGRIGGVASELSDHDRISSLPRCLARYVSAVLVSLALAEGIGIQGFVLFIIGGDVRTFHIFTVAAAVAIFYHRPKRNELNRLLAAAHGYHSPVSGG